MNHEQTKAFSPEDADAKALRSIAKHVLSAMHGLLSDIGDDGLFTENGKTLFELLHRQLRVDEAALHQANALGNKILDVFEEDSVSLATGIFALYILLQNTWKVYRKRVMEGVAGEAGEKMVQEALAQLAKGKADGHS